MKSSGAIAMRPKKEPLCCCRELRPSCMNTGRSQNMPPARCWYPRRPSAAISNAVLDAASSISPCVMLDTNATPISPTSDSPATDDAVRPVSRLVASPTRSMSRPRDSPINWPAEDEEG